MKLNQLQTVLAVADAGSLRAASRRLNIAQSAITRHISELERELGVMLFERHTRGVRLTTAGEILLRRVQTVDGELRRAREEIDHHRGNVAGEISAIFSSASSIGLLRSVIPRFRRRYPRTVLKFQEGLFQSARPQLESGQTDFYVGPLDISLSRTALSVEQLFANERLVFARPGHPLAGARKLADLVGAEWVRPSSVPQYTEADFSMMFTTAGLPPPNVVMHVNSAMMAQLLVSSSDMLTVLPRQWLALPGDSPAIRPLPLELKMEAAPICIVRRADLPPTPMCEHLIDLLRLAGEEQRQPAA